MTIGAKFRAQGYTPCKPIIVVPGLCSSCLVVQESPYEDWIGQQIWLNLGSIGFDKILLGNVLRNLRSNNNKPKTQVEVDQSQKRKWIQHMVLDKDAISDPEGIKLRAVKGLKGCAYLETHTIMNGLSYVMGPLFETLQDAGYTDKNLKAAPYDWRVPPGILEERDLYFTELKQMVQQMYAENGQKVVLLGHSLGTRVIHYFLLFLEDTVGRSWIDEKIDSFIAVGPLWLGAPKSIRAAVTGERMGLEDFLYPEEGLQLARRCGSSGWMYPFHTPECEFAEYSNLKDEKTNQYIPKTIQEIMEISQIPYQWTLYENMFLKNKYFGSKDNMLKAPPIGNIFSIYGINLKTESFYFFKKNTSPNAITELELDPDGQYPNYVCEGGIAFETKDTKQNILKGKACSGDGTVTYASLAYCKKWRKSIKVRVEELDQADHRVILKDKRFHRLVLEAICKPPPLQLLPTTFSKPTYEVAKLQSSNGKYVSGTLKLAHKGIKLLFSIRKINNFYPYPSIVSVAPDMNDPNVLIFMVTRANGNKSVSIKSQQRDIIITELNHRKRFVEEGSKWDDEVRNTEGQTSLHIAAAENRVDNIFKYLHEGADINAIDNKCFTPLHVAADLANLDVCLVLLQQSDIDCEKLSSGGFSIFHYLVRIKPSGDEDMEKLSTILELVKSKGSDINLVNNDGVSCLHDAITFNSFFGVSWLLDKKANINIADNNGNTPLHYATTLENFEMVQILVKNGADKHLTNKNGESSLKLAKNNEKIFDFLSGQRRNMSSVDLRKFTANNRSRSEKQILINQVDEYGQTALHKAAYENRIDVVYSLIVTNECDINCRDRNGWTPLHCAANRGNLDVCIMLLNIKEIDVNAKTDDETFVIHYLARLQFQKDTENEKLLNILNMAKQRGLHVNVKEKYGETALHQAARKSNTLTAQWLLENGALINAQTSKFEFTPLHYAVRSRKIEMIKLLLENGADPTLVSNEDGSCIDLARKTNSPDILEMLTSSPKVIRAPRNTFSTIRKLNRRESTFRMGNHKLDSPNRHTISLGRPIKFDDEIQHNDKSTEKLPQNINNNQLVKDGIKVVFSNDFNEILSIDFVGDQNNLSTDEILNRTKNVINHLLKNRA